ncbi:MAG: hypothetical protein M3198_16700, partial [Actinomycetota bacterium]|nr:hypothetical protein [Actinomycetota bacterium]
GHFERGGEPRVKDVRAEVKTVVFFRRLDPRRQLSSLTYLCFGEAKRLFLAHEIGGRPNFDQVLQARLPGRDFERMKFRKAAPVRFLGTKDSTRHRLRPRTTVTGNFFQTSGPRGEHGFNADIEIGEELYFEAGELR